MLGRVRVFGGVAVGRVVATEGGTALLTRSQMHPTPADFHALLAFMALRVLDGRHRADVVACHAGHVAVLSFVENLVDEGDRDRAFADGRRHTFDIAAAHVADREHATQACFEQMGSARQRPTCRRQVVL